MHKDRAVWVSVAFLALVFGAYMLRETGGAGWMPGCTFRKLTGLECPGCGMTRAAHAALNGRLAQAFSFNPVGMILLPLAMLGVSLEVISWARGKPLPFHMRVGMRGSAGIAAVLIVFWIGRNLI